MVTGFVRLSRRKKVVRIVRVIRVIRIIKITGVFRFIKS